MTSMTIAPLNTVILTLGFPLLCEANRRALGSRRQGAEVFLSGLETLLRLPHCSRATLAMS